MKRFKLVTRHLLILFSLSVTLFCFGTAAEAEKQSASETKVQRTENQKRSIRLQTPTKQKKTVSRTDEVNKKKTSSRILKLRQSWQKNRAKTTKQSQSKGETTETASGRKPADPTVPVPPHAAVNLGIQTPELPKPFYADTESEGNRHGLVFGVQTQEGAIYAFIEKEVTEEGVISGIGIRGRFKLEEDSTFFKRARDVLLFVPKKIGTGVLYFGRGVKDLLW